MQQRSSKTKSIVLVDDHPTVRDGMKSVITREPNLVVVGESGNREGAIRTAKEHKPDFMVMDISLAGENGIEIAAEILKMLPNTNIIMFSMYSDVNLVKKAFKIGAKGYLVKETPTENLVEAIESISAGNDYYDPSLTAKMMDTLTGKRAAKPERPKISILYDNLTIKEQEIFSLVGRGLTNREISAKLNIAYPTTRNHIANIMEKMQTNSRTMLVKFAVELEILDF